MRRTIVFWAPNAENVSSACISGPRSPCVSELGRA